MRLLGALSALVTLAALITPTVAVIEDEAYGKDWHIPLIGASLRPHTFFHRPQPDSKASIIYTLTDKNVLAAINPKDGALLWRHSVSEDLATHPKQPKALTIARPADGMVISSAGRVLRAWGAADGGLMWAAEFEKAIKDFRVSTEGVISSLCSDGSIRSVSSADGAIMGERNDILAKYAYYIPLPSALTYS